MWHWSPSPSGVKMFSNSTLFETTDHWPCSPGPHPHSVRATNSRTKPILPSSWQKKQPALMVSIRPRDQELPSCSVHANLTPEGHCSSPLSNVWCMFAGHCNQENLTSAFNWDHYIPHPPFFPTHRYIPTHTRSQLATRHSFSIPALTWMSLSCWAYSCIPFIVTRGNLRFAIIFLTNHMKLLVYTYRCSVENNNQMAIKAAKLDCSVVLQLRWYNVFLC